MKDSSTGSLWVWVSSAFKIINHLSAELKKKISIFFYFSFFAAILDVIGVGSILPFLIALINPEELLRVPGAQHFLEVLNLDLESENLVPVIACFSFAVLLLTNTVRLSVLYGNSIIAAKVNTYLSVSLFNYYLRSNYLFHIQNNSATLREKVFIETQRVGVVIYATMQLFSNLFIVLFLSVSLIFITPATGAIALVGLGLCYFLIYMFTEYRVRRNGFVITDKNFLSSKMINESFSGIKNIKLFDMESTASWQMYKARYALNMARAHNQFLSLSPRYVIELLLFTLILAFLSYLNSKDMSIETIIPEAGVFGMAAYRIIPSIQVFFNSAVVIKSHIGAFDSMKEELFEALASSFNEKNNEVNKVESLPFNSCISVEDLSFRYPQKDVFALKDCNLKIMKGQRVAFVGSTGSGKSTLLDILLGFLDPTRGVIKIDEISMSEHGLRKWQNSLGYVPQDIYLMDLSIAENIAFGLNVNEISHERLRMVAKMAEIDEHIISLEKGYETIVGERGVQLSGGQKQRIGIARALYRNSEIIVFDEATSALDNQTEAKLMNNIYDMNQDITIIMVAHRLSTVRSCDKIFVLEKGELVSQGSYDDLENQCSYFSAMCVGVLIG